MNLTLCFINYSFKVCRKHGTEFSPVGRDLRSDFHFCVSDAISRQ